MTEFEKMLAGKDFDGGAECINEIRENASNLLLAINQNTHHAQRTDLFQQLMGNIATSSIIRSPFHCEFGKTIFIGEKPLSI